MGETHKRTWPSSLCFSFRNWRFVPVTWSPSIGHSNWLLFFQFLTLIETFERSLTLNYIFATIGTKVKWISKKFKKKNKQRNKQKADVDRQQNGNAGGGSGATAAAAAEAVVALVNCSTYSTSGGENGGRKEERRCGCHCVGRLQQTSLLKHWRRDAKDVSVSPLLPCPPPRHHWINFGSLCK